MNALCYKIVFSKRLGALVAVGEHTAGQGKAAGTGVRTVVFPSSSASSSSNFVGLLKSISASVALSFLTAGVATAAGPAVNTLPIGYSVNSGNVAITSTSSATNAAMTIKQTTDKASINWNSFSIGSGAAVNVVQNSASSVLLNRVVGNDPSQIFGKLTANGQVILINPNGIVFGKGGSVTASAFTATTFGMSEEDFKKGKYKYARNGSTAGITVEQGASINTTVPGGYVALISSTVNNQGSISTKQGAVVMAAGESVALPSALTDGVGIPLSSKVRLELAPSTINASIENGGTITTEGGQVLMQAAAISDAVASITHTGTIDTTGDQGGAVTLLAEGGHIKATGDITANSTDANNKGGDIIIGRDEVTGELAASTDVSGAHFESKGGFVETSGDWLAAYGTKVKAKDWLLDPFNITILGPVSGTPYADPNGLGSSFTYTPGATSNILASDIAASLNDGTNVKISTGLTGSAGLDAGNINVNANITKTLGAAATLTLEAQNNITFNNGAKITDVGAGNLGVHLIANGASGTGSSLRMNADTQIDVGGAVNIDVDSHASGSGNPAIFMALGSLSAANPVGSRTTIKGGSVDINMNLSGTDTSGLVAQHSTAIIASNADINITANYTNAATGNATNTRGVLMGSNWNGSSAPGASQLTASNGAIKVETKTAGTNASSGLDFADTAITAKNDINLLAQTNSATATAINVHKEFNNPVIQSTSGNVNLLANQGGIALSSLTTGSITGKDIVINNTGSGTARDSNGLLTKGTGSFSGASGAAVSLIGAGNSVMAASGRLSVMGVGSGVSNSGVSVSANVSGGSVDIRGETVGLANNTTNGVLISGGSVTATAAAGNVNITGANAGAGAGVYSGVAIASNTGGDVNITGTSATGMGALLQGTVTAGKNVTISGTSSDAASIGQGVVIQNAVKANTGDITVTGDTNSAGSRAVSITANSAVNGSLQTVATGRNININADTLVINPALPASSVNAGSSGTVTIKTTSGNAIALGAVDTASATPASRVLGLEQGELDRITAGQLNIGATNGGNVEVTSAITTATTTGNLALRSGGNIAMNAALTVGGVSATKNLTLNGAGASSAITQSAAIKAAGLELLGANATHTLTNSGNDIKKLAGNTQTVSLTNNAAFGIDTVNTVGLTTSGNTTLNSTAAVTQTQALKAAGLELLGTGGSYTLNNADNTIAKLAGYTGTVSLTNKGDLAIDTVNTAGLTTTGNVSLTTNTAGNLTLKKNITALNKTVTLNVAGSVLRDAAAAADGIIKAGTLLVKAGGSVGTSVSRIKTDVANLSAESGTGQYITEADAVTLAAKAGGNIDIETTNGTMIVGAVTGGLTGVDATPGSGNIVLAGNTSTNSGLQVNKDIKGNAGVDISASANTSWGLTVNGATIQASGPINITGKTGDGQDLGVLIWNGSSIIANNSASAYADGANAISIRGLTPTNNFTSSGRNVVINGGSSIINNSNNGDTYIYGQSTQVSFDPATVITNASTAGKIKVLADNNALLNVGTVGPVLAKITQNSNKGVSIVSNGNGNVLVPSIVNNGSGDVVIAAGSSKAAGDGSGGQVKTSSGGTITNNAGKTYIYTGNASDTGKLENLMGSLATLYLSKVGDNTQNAQLNTSYANAATAPLNSIQNGATAQVMFRENTKFDEIQINPATLTKTVDQIDPTNASFAAAVAAANANGATLTKVSITENKFKISTDAAGMTGTLPTPSNQARTVGTYDYTVTPASNIATKVTSTSGTNSVAKLVVQASNVIPVPNPVVPTINPTRVRVPVGSANPFTLASAEDVTDDVCSANNLENCHCEESSLNQGVDICYEPKGSAR